MKLIEIVFDWIVIELASSGGRGPPPTPPPTYLWEEVRRSRSRGGYPWTILDKEPFDDYLDVDPHFKRYLSIHPSTYLSWFD